MSTEAKREVWVREGRDGRYPWQTSLIRNIVICCDGESCAQCRIARYVPEREWITGNGAELPENTWAYVNHPTYGVEIAQRSYYTDTEPGEPEQRMLTWTLYDVGQVVPAEEVTDYQLLGPLPAPPERKP